MDLEDLKIAAFGSSYRGDIAHPHPIEQPFNLLNREALLY